MSTGWTVTVVVLSFFFVIVFFVMGTRPETSGDSSFRNEGEDTDENKKESV
ncbi:hypothetical protein [Ectobacillus polymachus]|uniref:hypothetical protein n=1 Tax=Ectobacillus polymachus TaxID=1508806 RepID=UPI003A86C576